MLSVTFNVSEAELGRGSAARLLLAFFSISSGASWGLVIPQSGADNPGLLQLLRNSEDQLNYTAGMLGPTASYIADGMQHTVTLIKLGLKPDTAQKLFVFRMIQKSCVRSWPC